MSYWQKLYFKRDWSTLNRWWSLDASDAEAKAFLELLNRDIPKVLLRNGMEQRLVPVSVKEAPSEWKGGAQILALGELASRVYEAELEAEAKALDAKTGIAKDASLIWERDMRRVSDELEALSAQPEVTKGDQALSRAAHIRQAQESLAELQRISSLAIAAMGPDRAEQDWLRETLSEVKRAALFVGYHYRSALGKSIEVHAVRGEKSIKAAALGGEMANAALGKDRKEFMVRMNELLAKGGTVSAAARKHARETGKTPKSVADRYYRLRNKLGNKQ